jgi:polar amino acid transport system substrate-binding protein
MTIRQARHLIRLLTATGTVAALALTAACGSTGASSASTGSATTTAASAKTASYNTVAKNTLTVAAGLPAYTPWVFDNKPQSGKGFESALVYALAKRMGYSAKQVKWTRCTYEAGIAPGPKDWDMAMQEFGITPERRKAVDFSPSYFKGTQALLVSKRGKFANATKVSDFRHALVGAMVGTESYNVAKSVSDNAKVFDTNADAVQALDSGQIDALVTATTISVNMVRTKQVRDGKVVGQIPGTEDKYGFGFVLPKGSSLTPVVTKALNSMKKDGSLAALQKKWLADYTTGVPTLKK